MDFRQSVLDIPRALGETLGRAKLEYEALVRATRWGEIPVHIVAPAPLVDLAIYGSYALETLLGWPAVVREALDFMTYGTGVLRQRSVVLLVSASGEEQELFAVAQAARARGAVVLTMAGNPFSAVAKAGHGVFLIRPGDDCAPLVKSAVCLQAGLGHLGLTLARLLKKPQAVFADLEEEFTRLPEQVEKVLTQLSDAARTFGSELNPQDGLRVAAEGCYRSTAMSWSKLLGHFGFPPPQVFEGSAGIGQPIAPGEKVVLLSGSRCRLKKRIYEQAMRAKRDGARLLAVTDGNDRELADRADLTVLLPTLHEMTGSLLTLVLLSWSSYHAVHERDPGVRQSRRTGQKKI